MAVSYPVTEIFHSIQGEGLNAGRSAWFVRLFGCTLSCPGCDEPLHKDETKIQRLTVQEIIDKLDVPAELIVITGGEPTLHNLKPLVEAFDSLPWKDCIQKVHPIKGVLTKPFWGGIRSLTFLETGPLVCIETNGTKKVGPEIDYICVSPKPASHAKSTNIRTQMAAIQQADEIKIVVGWTDVKETQSLISQYSELSSAQILLSPLTQFPGNTLIQETADQAVELVKANAARGVRLSLQTHKWLKVR